MCGLRMPAPNSSMAICIIRVGDSEFLLGDVEKAFCPVSDVIGHARESSCRCPDFACMALTSLELVLLRFHIHGAYFSNTSTQHPQGARVSRQTSLSGRTTNRTQTAGDQGGMTGLRRGRMSARPTFKQQPKCMYHSLNTFFDDPGDGKDGRESSHFGSRLSIKLLQPHGMQPKLTGRINNTVKPHDDTTVI